MRVVSGSIFDVAVDIRKGSETFGRWFGTVLSDRNKRQLYVPKGMAHGFCTIKVPIPGLILSNTFRTGMIGMAKTLADELAEYGILINTVAPG